MSVFEPARSGDSLPQRDSVDAPVDDIERLRRILKPEVADLVASALHHASLYSLIRRDAGATKFYRDTAMLFRAVAGQPAVL